MSSFETDFRSSLESRRDELTAQLKDAGEMEAELGRIEAALVSLGDAPAAAKAQNGGARRVARQTAPTARKPAASKATSAAKSANGKAPTADAVLAVLAEGPKSSEAIRAVLGGTADELRKALGDLLAAGKISKKGERRATKYTLV